MIDGIGVGWAFTVSKCISPPPLYPPLTRQSHLFLNARRCLSSTYCEVQQELEGVDQRHGLDKITDRQAGNDDRYEKQLRDLDAGKSRSTRAEKMNYHRRNR